MKIIASLAEKVKRLASEADVRLGLAVFLLAALAFGAGWLLGAGVEKRPPIVVNCPAELFQNPQK